MGMMKSGFVGVEKTLNVHLPCLIDGYDEEWICGCGEDIICAFALFSRWV